MTSEKLPTHMLLRGVRTAIDSLTIQQMCGIMTHAQGIKLPANLMRAIARTLRRKSQAANVAISEDVLRVMNVIDPPACACGAPGIYIVGTETSCRRCVQRISRSDMATRLRRDAALLADAREGRKRQ